MTVGQNTAKHSHLNYRALTQKLTDKGLLDNNVCMNENNSLQMHHPNPCYQLLLD